MAKNIDESTSLQHKKKSIYIFKSNANWGDAITEQAKIFQNSGHEVIDFSKHNIISVNISLIMAFYKRNSNTVFINHSINVYRLLPAILCKPRWIITILLAHEGEPLFKKRNSKISFQMLRHSKLYHRMAAKLADRLIVLNDQQIGVYKKEAKTLNFLGTNATNEHDQHSSISKTRKRLAFPSNSNTYGKGIDNFHKFTNVLKQHLVLDVFINTGMPHAKLMNELRSSDIIALTNDEYETYSMILVEALSLNKLIVASSKLGLVQNFQRTHTNDHLSKMGLFIYTEPSELASIARKVSVKNNIHTRRLYDEFGLDCQSATDRLFKYAETVI